MSPIISKLPDVGTTIFTVMSQLAAQHQAINLGQGFPDFSADERLIEAVCKSMREGHNQYPPMAGLMTLREQIAHKTLQLSGHTYDPVHEVTVTAGATQAIFTAILALLHAGEEAIVLTPCYDSYIPAIRLAGGIPVAVPLSDTFRLDIQAIQRAMTPKTRLLIINTPHNPCGTIFSKEDWEALAHCLVDTDIFIISDEVYEHMVFDGKQHVSAATHAAIAERSVIVSSFGKTFHVTGWKVGYALAPAAIMKAFRAVHQFNVFTVNTPMQHAFAYFLQEDPSSYQTLSRFYQDKRDYLSQGLIKAGFRLYPCEGTYFQLADPIDAPALSAFPKIAENGLGLCEWLIEKIGVAAIPLSAFYPPTLNTADAPDITNAPSQVRHNTPSSRLLRFCFAKKNATLDTAISRLTALD